MNHDIKETSNGVNLRERKFTKQEESNSDSDAEVITPTEFLKSKKTFGKTPDGTGE